MAGSWLVEVWDKNGKRAKEEHSFTGFPALVAYVRDFKEQKSDDILRVHLPSQATGEQRGEIIQLGGQLF